MPRRFRETREVTANDLRRLARLVGDARVVLYDNQSAAAAAAGVGTTLWGLLENGKKAPKNPTKKRGVEKALGWPNGSIDRILAGESLDDAGRSVSLADRLTAILDDVQAKQSEIERKLEEARQVARLVQQDYEGPPEHPEGP